jgi:hypothetical protein
MHVSCHPSTVGRGSTTGGEARRGRCSFIIRPAEVRRPVWDLESRSRCTRVGRRQDAWHAHADWPNDRQFGILYNVPVAQTTSPHRWNIMINLEIICILYASAMMFSRRKSWSFGCTHGIDTAPSHKPNHLDAQVVIVRCPNWTLSRGHCCAVVPDRQLTRRVYRFKSIIVIVFFLKRGKYEEPQWKSRCW